MRTSRPPRPPEARDASAAPAAARSTAGARADDPPARGSRRRPGPSPAARLRAARGLGDAAPAEPPSDLQPVARVVDAYGIRGWVKLQPYGDAKDSVLLSCDQWWLRRPAGPPSAAAAPAGPRPHRAEIARAHGATVVARLAGVDDRDAALAWRGAEVLVSRARFPALPEGEYYWADLVGCEVFARDGACLGRVASVDDHGAHAIIEVAPQAGRSFLVPFVDAFVDRVDLAARRIDVDWHADYA